MLNTASVKIGSNAKILLDNVQQELRSIGIKVTEQKILDTLIENSDITHIKKLLRKDENTALAMLKKPVRWGIADASETVDRYLYGEDDGSSD